MVATKLYLAGAIGALVVILGLAAGLLWFRSEATAARADAAKNKTALEAAVAVNLANNETIKRLTAYREIDDKLMVDLQGRLSGLATQADAAIKSVRELEKTNADVATFLRNSLPDELKRLLNSPANSDAAKPSR